ncbi:C4-dicarboxylate transporter, DctM subunit [Acetomicrobium thermoterrenum DSM 13490]|uniref:C4-dicarboxylate transporter, DctM subunit n=1 Tax=Acetomicrobium thermoterrenum DSM 13490 TaxID=1120987 RepID=A0A1H3G2Z9_9BACT|nr:TRAP transporter large permease [Acetomicrobium thermoterrenum]SDX97068.1 C4-dicarboxylate transporter, DctM subunit [Acetomicrobium thermoterrenum DSM 13490]
MEALLLFALLIIFISLSVPIGVTIGLATAICLATTTDIPLVLVAQKSVTGLDSFPLLAIPYFILAGALMLEGGISRRLVNLADSLLGFVTGGLSMVTVLACMFFAAISGSGPATVSAIGSFMIPAMRDRGYDSGFAAALTACAGSIGVIIPPSIPFVIYGVVAQVSIGDMFIAGIIPGIILGIALMTVCYIISRKKGYLGSAQRPSLKAIGRAFKEAVWALIIPVIVLGGIYGGIFTPTEAAVVTVVYAFFVGKFVYKELTLKKIYNCLLDSSLVNGVTQFMIGLSMAFASYLALAQIPSTVASWLSNISSTPWVTLLIINIFLLIMGCFVDNIPAVIILTPILLPIMRQLGVDPIHFGVFLTVNLAVGFVTPPYGINLFVATAISGESIERISKNLLYFIAAMILCVLLLTNIPGLSLWLVGMLNR